MPVVTVLVNGRNYNVACDEGEEDHLRELGEHLDHRVCELANAVGQIGDARLLVMAGLLISDDLSNLLARLEQQEQLIEQLRQRNTTLVQAMEACEEFAAAELDRAAVTIEAIAQRVSEP